MAPLRVRICILLLAALPVIWRGSAVELTRLTEPRQRELLEFRIDAVPAAGNRFDPDELAIDAILAAPSGKRLAVPAFWFQDYTRKLVGGKEQLAVKGAGEWRLRLMPVERGDHALSVTVRINGVATGVPAKAMLSVAAAASTNTVQRGLVRIAANKRYFETDAGEPLPLVGHCVCWHGQRGTFDYDDWLPAMSAVGENYTRLWMAPWALGIEAEPGTSLNYRLDRAWQLDQLFALAGRHGIRILLCLDYHGMFETEKDWWGGNDNWRLNPYNQANGGPCANQDEFFTNATARKRYQARLRYLVARHGWSENLLAWQFFNELDNVYRWLIPEHVATWHAEMGDWLKANDPWRHLVTTSMTGGSDRQDIWTLPQMDFAVYHSYGLAQPAAKLPEIINSFVTRYQKPMLVGEFGTDWRGWRREQDPFLRGWRQGIWAGALGGSAGTSMSWWWEDIHASNLYSTYRALLNCLEPAGWGRGDWRSVEFETSDAPPAATGDLQPDVVPFTAVLVLNSDWGAKLCGTLAVPDPNAAAYASVFLNSFVHGSSHAELRLPFRIDAWFTNQARLVMHLNSVSGGAILSVRQDGRELLRRPLPNKDGEWKVANEYNEDIAVDLAPGRHVVEIRNVGADWFYLDWVRLENVLPAGYSPAWIASPVATGMQGEAKTLLYVVNPAVSFPANATNAQVAALTNSQVVLRQLAAGRYQAVWYDPKTAARVAETAGVSDGMRLVLPLPDVVEDLAGRIERVEPFSLQGGRFRPPVGFESQVVGGGRIYRIEQSMDLARWNGLARVTNSVDGGRFRDAGNEAGDRRFYRARLED